MPRAGLCYAPLLGWALAAQWWGIDWDHFEQLDGDLQSFLVAVHEEKMTMDAVMAKAQVDDMKKNR